MRSSGPDIVLSATDLSNFLGCRHRTALDLAVVGGGAARPFRPADPLIEILAQRGKAHEARYVQALAAAGKRVVDLNGVGIGQREEAMARTLEAMRGGVDVIVQAALGEGRWFGLADILQRVEHPSALGAWSYEVADTKLARETRGGTILQLTLYSELVGEIQGVRPERFHVVTPDPVAPVQTYRVDDYASYAAMVRRHLLEAVAMGHEALAALHYPEPVDACTMCPWWKRCRDRRVADDHLSLVAGITRTQRDELERHGISTLSALARLDALPFKPLRGSADTYLRAIGQAEAQLASRGKEVPVHRRRATLVGEGLARLPVPSPGDLFLDLEGDPHADVGGREYLFGLVSIAGDGTPTYESFWALDAREERLAFEAVIDRIMARWKAYPGMHVYHYAPYEPSAFKRLMGRHVTRIAELDDLLRGSRFVDLYAVVRQGLHVGVERYSIKNLEPAYDYRRAVALPDANVALRSMEQHLQLGTAHATPDEVRSVVEGYNRDDCLSTWRLREWLESVRASAMAEGEDIPRPSGTSDEAPQSPDERQLRADSLRQQLLSGLPDDPASHTDEHRARRILAYLVDYHRREDKATWWEYFRLRDLAEDDLLDEPQAVAGLQFVERVEIKRREWGNPTGSVTDRYAYPPQEIEIGVDDDLRLTDSIWGKVVSVDRVGRTMDVFKGPKRAEVHASAAFAHTYVNPGVLEDSIIEVAEHVIAAGGVGSASSIGAARDLLLATPPRLLARDGHRTQFDGTGADADMAERMVLALDHGVLAVQGPPGAGKTYAGARMICALVRAGKRVGVAAASHKVVRNLLDEVVDMAREAARDVRVAQRINTEGTLDGLPDVREVTGNPEAVALLDEGAVDVLGATPWFWARADVMQSVDVLVIDEAGQMALANAVAMARAAQSLVLLGDPRQLEQPSRGTHPDGIANSALRHVLGDHATMPPDRGLFLPVTWRLSPPVCAFTSAEYYEGQLRSLDGLEGQVLSGCGRFDGSGVFVVPVEHEGNRGYSEEEVDVIEQVVRELTAPGATWTNAKGERAPLTTGDILVVAPYNAQVARLGERLSPLGVACGTVDRFQGQEAPVVIYSMAASSAADAPRGMEFLFSRNRFNVATSRARCAAILVASPRVFEAECHSPRQMRLANGVCRFVEMSDG